MTIPFNYKHYQGKDPTTPALSLSKIGKGDIQAIEEKVKTLPHPERIQEFKSLAHRVLNKPHEIKTTLQQFAFMHCSTYLEDTPMEGGQLDETLAYWKDLFEAWKKGSAQIVDPNIQAREVDEMLSGIQDCIDFEGLMKQGNSEAEIVTLIEKKLREKGSCFFPTGWRGRPGHFMVCKFRKQGNEIIAELMTKGGGAEYHRVLTMGKHRQKRDYRFEPIALTYEDLHNVISRITQLQQAAPGNDFDSLDLYGLFLLAGKIVPRAANDVPGVGVTCQRSGTCVETGLHVLLYESDPKKINRRMFALKFQSLVDGYRQFKDRISIDHALRFYLAAAAKEHLVRLAKLHPEVISSDEFMLGYAVANEIQEVCQKADLEATKKLKVETPSLTHRSENPVPVQFPKIEEVSPHRKGDISKEGFGLLRMFMTASRNLPSIEVNKPEEVIPTLENLLAYFKNHNLGTKMAKMEKFAQIHRLIASLPVTSGDLTDPFWDQLSPAEASRCIALLREALVICHDSAWLGIGETPGNQGDMRFDKERLFELSARSYDISCQLAQRLPHLKLQDYGFHWEELPDYCRHGSTALTLMAIDNNFRKRNARAKNGILFPLEIKNIFSFTKIPHLVYLKQIVDSTKKEDKDILLSNDRTLFPDEFMDLRIFSYLCYPRASDVLQGVWRSTGEMDKWSGYKALNTSDYDPKDFTRWGAYYQGTKEKVHPKLLDNPYGERGLQDLPKRQHKENEVLCKAPQLDIQGLNLEGTSLPLSKQVLEELALMCSSPTLQITDALNWACANVHLLNNPLVQGHLENLLFSTKAMAQTLDQSFQPTFRRIHQFINLACYQYAGQAAQLNTLLWLTRLGVYFENGVMHHRQYQSAGETFPDYFSILENIEGQVKTSQERSYLYQHMLITFANCDPKNLSLTDCERLLTARMKLEMIGWELDPKAIEMTFDAAQASAVLHQHLKDRVNGLKTIERDALFNRVLFKLTGKKASKKSTWTQEGSLWVRKKTSIQLDFYAVFYEGRNIQDADAKMTLNDDYKKVFGHAPYPYIDKDGIRYRLPNEDFRIIAVDSTLEKLRIQKKMILNGREGWYEYLPEPESVPPLLADGFQHWVSTEGEPKEIIVYDKNREEVLYSQRENGEIILLDPKNGTPTSQTMMNIYTPNKGSVEEKWREFIGRFDDPDKVIITQQKEGDNVKVTRILFKALSGLSFSLKGERLQCDQDPDYTLALDQEVDLLSRMKGPILLESHDRKSKKVILPTHGISYTGAKPTSLASQNHTPLNIGGKGYFVYDVSSDGKSLNPESPRAALYLSLVYRSLKEYETAFAYLQKSYKFENDELDDLKIVRDLLTNDRFPEAAAFDCHLALRMAEHRTKHTKSSFIPKTAQDEEAYKEQEKWLYDHFKCQYEAYHERTSDYKEGIGAIPQSLRLSVHQENYFLHNKGGRSELELNLNHDVLSPGEMTSLSAERKKRLEQGLGTKFEGMTSAVRFSNAQSYVEDHFVSLYEMARSLQAKDQLSFKMMLFFLARSPIKREDRMEKLLSILIDVTNNPRSYSSMDSLDFESSLKKIVDCYSSRRSKEAPSLFPRLPAAVTPVATSPKKDPHLPKVPSEKHPFTQRISSKIAPVVAFPLKEAAGLYIVNKAEISVATGPFPLENRDLSKESPLVVKQVEALAKGHQLNASVKNPHYGVQQDRLKSVESLLKSSVAEDEAKVHQLTIEIETLANVTLKERARGLTKEELVLYLDQLNKKKGGQVKKIKLEDLIGIYLRKDTQALFALNPALEPQDADLLFEKLLELFVIGCRGKQAKEGLDIVPKLAKVSSSAEREALSQQLASCLDRKRNYDPRLRPEFAVYEFATGMLLRKDQVELLEWIFNNLDNPNIKNVLFQFAAGGGKTKVLLPILAFYISSKGKLPVALNISSLYEIGKGDLDKSLAKAFKQNLEVLEIDLDTEMTTERLSAVFHDIQKWHQNKKCIAIKTETWHALHLKYQLALDLKDSEQIALYYKILDTFKTLGVALVDEGHQSLDPMHESNIACGESSSLSTREQKMTHAVMQMLAGQKENILVKVDLDKYLPIQEVVHLLENQQAMLTDAQLKGVQKALIATLILDPLFEELKKNPRVQKLTENVTGDLRTYLKKINASKPKWLVDLHESENEAEKELASMVVHTKKLLYETLPHTLRMIQSINYDDAVNEADLTCAPRHNKQPVTSKFQEVYVTLALTVQNVIQKGINSKKVTHILELLLKEHVKQKRAHGASLQNTKAQELFNSWWSSSEPGPPLLDQIYPDLPAQMEEIANRIGRHPEVIKHYLLRCALPQIRVYHEKMSSTPPDLLEGFSKNIVFSATPGMIELYPVSLQNPANPVKGEGIRLDLGFEAAVMDMLCQTHNEKVVTLSVEKLPQFFEDLEKNAPGIVRSLCAIIDQGGIFRAFENGQVVDALVKFAKSKGIPFTGGIYRREASGLLSSETGQLVMREEGKPDVSLRGSDLKESLKLVGKKFDEVMLATFFDKAITTGADILQPVQAGGLLTVGEGSTKTNLLQAAMRFRRLLLGKNSQHLLWVIQKEMEAQIPRAELDRLTPQDLFMWMIRNEAALVEKAIVMRGFQGITHLIRKLAWQRIDTPGLPPEKRSELYHHFRKGLVDKLVTDPYETFGKKMQKEDADFVLSLYALNCAQLLGLDENFKQLMNKEDQLAYELLISETKALVGKISVASAQQSQEMHQKQEARQQVRQEQRSTQEAETSTALEPFSEYYLDGIDSLSNRNFLTPKFLNDPNNHHHTLRKILDLNILPEDVFVSDSFMKVSKNSGRELRQIPYLLVVQDEGQLPRYLLCSRAGAAHYKEQLVSPHNIPAGRNAMLIDINGQLVQNGNGSLGFSQNLREMLLESEGAKDRLAILSFMNGQVKDVERLKRLARDKWTHEEFQAAVSLIKKVHVGQTPIDQELIDSISTFRKIKKATLLDLSEELIPDTFFRRIIRFLFPTRLLSAPPKPLTAEHSIKKIEAPPAPSWFNWLQVGS